jgi:hypothetical protein
MKNSNRTFRKLRGVEEAEGVRSEGVYHRMEIDPTDPFERTDEEGVLAEEGTRAVRFDMPFPEARICLLNQGDLFSREFDCLLAVSFFQCKQTVVPGTHAIVGKDLLHGDVTDPGPVKRQEIRNAIASPGGMIQTQAEDPIDDLRRRSLRMRMVRGREILQPGKSMRLKPTFPFVETVPIHPLPTTRLRDIPQRFGQLEDRETVMGEFLMRVFGRDARCAHNPQRRMDR